MSETSELGVKSEEGNVTSNKNCHQSSLTTENINVAFNKFLNFLKPYMKLSSDQEAIIMKKFHKRFKVADPDYLKSNNFQMLLHNSMKQISDDKEHVFTYAVRVCDELNAYKVKKKKCVSESVSCTFDSDNKVVTADNNNVNINPLPSTSSCAVVNSPTENSLSVAPPYEISEKEEKKLKQNNNEINTHDNDDRLKEKETYIKRMEKLLEALDKKIKKLQAKELSLDNLEDQNSIYVIEHKLKQKFVKVYGIICRHYELSSKAGREVKKAFHYKATRYEKINQQIEYLINKKVSFPDYTDVYNIVHHENENSCLGLMPSQVAAMAEEIFKDVGNQLKMRRLYDESECFGSYLTDNVDLNKDPAEHDESLKQKLEKNNVIAEKKMDSVFDEFLMKQYALNEKPVEVADDVPTSPSDKGDDEDEEMQSGDEVQLKE